MSNSHKISDFRECLAIGLISGTSVDGIDTALVRISESENGKLAVQFMAGQTVKYAPDLRAEILAVSGGAPRSLPELTDLDDQIASAFANSALELVRATQQVPDFVASHGQTVWHRPPAQGRLGYSWQMGRGEVIAQVTGMTTIADFRRGDMAVGGEGAPLVPIVDWLLLRDAQHDRIIQNIGGISNFTYLPADATAEQVWGCDNAPGNVLIDLAMTQFYGLAFDRAGAIARSGAICPELVEFWLNDRFLHQPPPKSTGREYYNLAYLHTVLQHSLAVHLSPADIIASLTEFTARAIVASYQQFLPQMPAQVIVSGGGAHNLFLQERLQFWLGAIPLLTSDRVGINSDFKEAIAFAVLGYLRLNNRAANLPLVTGAKQAVPLGQIFSIASP